VIFFNHHEKAKIIYGPFPELPVDQFLNTETYFYIKSSKSGDLSLALDILYFLGLGGLHTAGRLGELGRM
jgi:hypothetical protein